MLLVSFLLICLIYKDVLQVVYARNYDTKILNGFQKKWLQKSFKF